MFIEILTAYLRILNILLPTKQPWWLNMFCVYWVFKQPILWSLTSFSQQNNHNGWICFMFIMFLTAFFMINDVFPPATQPRWLNMFYVYFKQHISWSLTSNVTTIGWICFAFMVFLTAHFVFWLVFLFVTVLCWHTKNSLRCFANALCYLSCKRFHSSSVELNISVGPIFFAVSLQLCLSNTLLYPMFINMMILL